MEQKVLIIKNTKDKNIKIGYINKETIKDIYLHLYYADTLRILQNIEKTFIDSETSFRLEIADYNDLALENFNRKLKDEDKIARYKTLEEFLINYAGNLALKGIDDQNIKTSLISISLADTLEEKSTVIKRLYKLLDDFKMKQYTESLNKKQGRK